MAVTAARKAEIKTHTSQVKADAAKIYSRWGLSLSDATDMFLVKLIEIGSPFDLRVEKPPYEVLAAGTCHAGQSPGGVSARLRFYPPMETTMGENAPTRRGMACPIRLPRGKGLQIPSRESR